MRVGCSSEPPSFIYLFFSPLTARLSNSRVDGSSITSFTIARDRRRFSIPFALAARRRLQRFRYQYRDINDRR